MIIIAGHLKVDPTERDDFLGQATEVVAAARAAPGCLDFQLSADPIEPDRVNVYERWESNDSVEAFRGDGPDTEQGARILTADVVQYEVAASTRL